MKRNLHHIITQTYFDDVDEVPRLLRETAVHLAETMAANVTELHRVEGGLLEGEVKMHFDSGGGYRITISIGCLPDDEHG